MNENIFESMSSSLARDVLELYLDMLILIQEVTPRFLGGIISISSLKSEYYRFYGRVPQWKEFKNEVRMMHKRGLVSLMKNGEGDDGRVSITTIGSDALRRYMKRNCMEKR